jgi:subtilisin-like proprotein convertase family protein
MKDGRRIQNTWRLVAVLFTVAAIAAPAFGGQTVVYPVALNQWVRETYPDTVYGPDTISVWSTQPDASTPGRRYGLIEFDVTPLAGKTLVSAELRLYQGAWDAPPNGLPMKQTSYVIATGPTSIVDLSWNGYFAEKDGVKQPLEGLGKYDLPAIAGAYGYQSSFATAADLALIQNEANGDGRLTLVMIADEDGTVYRRDWADPAWAPAHYPAAGPPILVVDDGTDCVIATTSLPAARLGNPYSATLETSAGCTGAQWAVIEGALPDGLTLDAPTGVISGTPGTPGTYAFKVQMTSTVATRTADLSITVVGDLIVFTPVKDVWLRESHPNNTYENDPLSVWSSASTNHARRYGVIEFDVSALAGLTLQSATLGLFSGSTGATQHGYLEYPQKQTSYVIDSGGTATASLTWNTYMAEFDATKVSLSRLGRYDLPANDPSQALTYMDSQASAADLALIAAAANGSGKLRIVMIAVEDGVAYERDWGDIEAWGKPAKLTVLTGSGCMITTPSSLPTGYQGAYYETQLEGTPGCGSGTWSVTNCFIPPGLILNPATGLMSGWSKFRGQFDFTVELTPAGGGQPQQKDLTINVQPSPADLDDDGDVDLVDFDEFVAEYTGPAAAPACDLGAPPSDVVVAEAAADTWIRNDGAVHEDDLISVWSSVHNLRYGLATFDLSALAGQTVRGAALELFATTGGSQQTFGINQTVSIVPGTALNATWDTYMATQDPSADLLDGLRHEFPGPKDGQYHWSTPASAADLAKIQAIVDGTEKSMTLVMKAVEDGTDYRVDWGDLGYDQMPARLHLIVGPACSITTFSLPAATVGTAYSATLETDGACTGALNWQVVACQLPNGLTLDPVTGAISGTPRVVGTFPFRVQLTSAQGTRIRDLAITVGGRAKADFNGDGVVDLLDFDALALSFTGVVGARPFCGTVNFPSTDTPLPIPDGGSVASVINVPAGELKVGDLNVFVDIAHPGREAVKIVLQSPTGTTVVLKDYFGDIGNFTPTTYDDEGSTPPAEPLSAVDGQDAAGDWTLTVYDIDAVPIDNGVLNSWKLIVTAQ